MSLNLYWGTKPKTSKKAVARLTSQELEERAAANKKRINPRLRLEEIVKNRPLPPCSQKDFMDYLMYVEGNAEYLQFFNWYGDYVRRWSELPSRTRIGAPKWDPETKEIVSSSITRAGSTREKQKLAAIMKLMEKDGRRERRLKKPSIPNLPKFPEPVVTDDPTWNYASQPFREEINNIVLQYITMGASRQLHLTHEERTAVMHAIEHTTHPSALLPAFMAAEAVLRGHCHPNFIAWSVSNANTEHIILYRLIAVLNLIVAAIMNGIFISKNVSKFWRISIIPFWFFGFMILMTSGKGICLILHWTKKRQVRPWETTADVQVPRGLESEKDLEANITSLNIPIEDLNFRRMDPLGGRNLFDDEPWVEKHRKRSIFCRTFEYSTYRCNPYIRKMQENIVMSATVWAGIIAGVLGIGSHFIPNMV